MSRFLRFVGLALAVVVGLLFVSAAGLYAFTSRAVGKKVESPEHGFAAPRDSASVARGMHVIRALAKCTDCHGADLGGSNMVDDAVFARLNASNLTSGNGGVLGGYSDAQLEAAIRHGVGNDGRRLLIMPSQEYQYLSDDDLGALIAALRALPPVDRTHPKPQLGPLSRALYAAGVLPFFGYEQVTHGSEVVASVPVDTTVAYGKYIGDVGCMGCHGETYGGGKIPGAPPEFPPPANLTPTGIGHYTYENFTNVLKTGVRPDGTRLHPFMPIPATSLMTEVEMRAVWNYLRTLPPREYGSR